VTVGEPSVIVGDDDGVGVGLVVAEATRVVARVGEAVGVVVFVV
jgi:hypothetical protein